jgi:hypothetical protein
VHGKVTENLRKKERKKERKSERAMMFNVLSVVSFIYSFLNRVACRRLTSVFIMYNTSYTTGTIKSFF